MKWATPVIAITALAGCNKPLPAPPQDEFQMTNPADRYQMTSDGKGGVYRLDTRMGTMSHCTAGDGGGGTSCDNETAVP